MEEYHIFHSHNKLSPREEYCRWDRVFYETVNWILLVAVSFV